MASPPPTPLSGPAPRLGLSCGPGEYASQGMISPTDPPFTNPATGTLSPVSFRFLYGVFSAVCYLEKRVAELEALVGSPTRGVFFASRQYQPTTQATSSAYTMMGTNFTFVPNVPTAFVSFDCALYNTQAGAVTICAMFYGQGPPPAAGAPQQGTLVGQPSASTAPANAGYGGMALAGMLQNLVPGETYWLDLGVSVSTGSGGAANIDFNVFGLPS